MFSKYPSLCRNIVVQLLLFSKEKMLQLLLHIPNCLTSWMRSPSSSLPWRLSAWFHQFGWLRGCMMWVKGGVEICIRTPRPWTAISKRREKEGPDSILLSVPSDKTRSNYLPGPRRQTPPQTPFSAFSNNFATWRNYMAKRANTANSFAPTSIISSFQKSIESPELTKVRSLILKPTVAIPNWSWLTADL